MEEPPVEQVHAAAVSLGVDLLTLTAKPSPGHGRRRSSLLFLAKFLASADAQEFLRE